MAALDWLPGYEAARVGVFGDQSDAVAQRYIQSAGDDYGKLYGNAITDPTYNNGAPATSGIDWNQLPAMGPAGFNLPNNSMWHPVGGRSGYQQDMGMPTYNDPNYGMLQLIQQRAPNSLGLDLAKAGAFALGGVGIAGGLGALGSGFGAGAAAGDAFLPAALAGPSTGSLVGAGLKTIMPIFPHWSEIFGGSAIADAGGTAAKAAATSNTPTPGLPDQFNAGLYGNMGSLANPPDGSAMVATGVAPDAYINSGGNYNTVVS